jgi:WD40 repeat protein
MTRVTLGFVVAWVLAGAPVGAQPRVAHVALNTPSPPVATMFAKNAPAAAAVCADHQLRHWDLASGTLVRTIDVTGREVAITAMSDDGQRMLMGDYRGALTVWNVATGEAQFEQQLDRYVTAAAFSHNGRLLAIAPGSRARVYDVASKLLLYELDPVSGSNTIAFSHDDALIATGDGDGIRIHDARTGKLLAMNTDLLAAPLAVDFTRDGKYVVAGGGDRVVLLIETATGKTAKRMRTTEAIFYLEVSPSGSELAVVTQKADNPQLSAPVLFIDPVSLARKAEWMSPAGVLLPGGAAWTRDGHFVAVTMTPDALHLWRAR